MNMTLPLMMVLCLHRRCANSRFRPTKLSIHIVKCTTKEVSLLCSCGTQKTLVVGVTLLE
jgi:hypothetical protein